MVLLGESQVIQVFIVGLWTVLPLEILLLIKQGIWNSINWFSSAHCCTCSKPAHSFPTSEAVVFCVFNGMKWEVIACFLILVKLLPITVLQFAIYQFSITVLKSLLWERNLSEWVSEWHTVVIVCGNDQWLSRDHVGRLPLPLLSRHLLILISSISKLILVMTHSLHVFSLHSGIRYPRYFFKIWKKTCNSEKR